MKTSDEDAVVVGMVLGAGSSRRLGRPKQSLPLGESTILGVSVDNAVSSTLDRIVLVVGHQSDQALEGVEPGRAVVTYNERYGTGCASSLLAGLDAAGPCSAIMIVLGDMPGVTASTIDSLSSAWRRRRTLGAIASYRGRLGHPLLLSSDAFEELRSLHGDKAVWKIVDREPRSSIARVNINEELPLDVDTWEDYEAVCAAFGFVPPQGLAPAQM